MDTLKSVGINLNGMVRQSMDGAGNMRSQYNGLKSVMLSVCPRPLASTSPDVNQQFGKGPSTKQNTTRWSHKRDALKTVLTCYKTIKETLEEICLDKKSDNDTKMSVKRLIK
ncbi:hypothetical protein PR048_007041, partial [Dryococelus australis]